MKMIASLCGLVAVLTLAQGVPRTEVRNLQEDIDRGVAADKLFGRYKQIFKKSYKDEKEHSKRLANFHVHVKRIKDHNKMFKKGTEKFSMRVNEIADMTHEEYVSKYFGLLVEENNNRSSRATFTPREMTIPEEIDWTASGYVTPVKHQGQCGSCWAFSSVGALEAQHKNKTGELISLSEQQLLDCSAYGCDGASMGPAFDYIISAGGIMSENDYPYLGQKTECKYMPTAKVASMSRYVMLPSGDKDALKEAVATVGPVSIAVDADKWGYAFYSGGIYDYECVRVNHAVLLTGYGSSPTPYWKIKNSWGTDWGEDGYIRVSQYGGGCGVTYYSVYPVV